MTRINHLQQNPIIIEPQQSGLRMTEWQCDACPAGISAKLEDKTRLYNCNYLLSNSHSICLNNDFKVVYGAYLKPTPIVLNESAFNLIRYFEQPKALSCVYEDYQESLNKKELNIILKQMIECNLIRPEEYIEHQFVESADTLIALLHLTTSCNLNCNYCYVSDNHSEISLSTGYMIIDTLFRTVVRRHCQFQGLKLKYTGGEPLLCFAKIPLLHEYTIRLAEKHGIEFTGSILSNGTLLTSKIIEKIKSLNMRLMISLDGLGDYHDCHRRFLDGSSSFKAVVQAIDLAFSHGLIPDISITVSSRSIDGLSDVIAWVLERDLPFSINFYRENDCSKKYKILQLEEEKIIIGMLAACKVIESSLPRQSLLASLVDRANLAMPHVRPCSVGRSYMVFDCEGRITKCPMQMNQPITDIYAEDPLSIIQKDTRGIQNITVDKKEECDDCQWRYWCAGGCPLATFRATGRYDVKSPNCNIYKALYPEVLRLEGLRLLKYASLLTN